MATKCYDCGFPVADTIQACAFCGSSHIGQDSRGRAVRVIGALLEPPRVAQKVVPLFLFSILGLVLYDRGKR